MLDRTRLQQILSEQGRSRKWLADALGIAEGSVQHWFSDRLPCRASILAIAQVLKVSPKKLTVSPNEEIGTETKGTPSRRKS